MEPKEQALETWRELNDLVAEWDPLGLIGTGAPRDEYDCLVGHLLRLLKDGATEDGMVAFLNQELREHFGVKGPPESELRAFVARARSWFERC